MFHLALQQASGFLNTLRAKKAHIWPVDIKKITLLNFFNGKKQY